MIKRIDFCLSMTRVIQTMYSMYKVHRGLVLTLSPIRFIAVNVWITLNL